MWVTSQKWRMMAEWKGKRVGREGGLAGWEVGALRGGPMCCSLVREAVGCRHNPAGMDEAPSTEAVPNVDGCQPGV